MIDGGAGGREGQVVALSLLLAPPPPSFITSSATSSCSLPGLGSRLLLRRVGGGDGGDLLRVGQQRRV